MVCRAVANLKAGAGARLEMADAHVVAVNLSETFREMIWLSARLPRRESRMGALLAKL